MAETNGEMMNRLFKAYGLTKDDIFAHKHYKIITRAGIDKIQARAGITVDYELLHVQRYSGGLDTQVA